ncbi:DUF1294 domain-containing protein [Chitinolyticbacter meiyuanensis]|uniref:DUF1294 domain-containing protein n=1 Tax=Chitinolyticbacter meiyuanensis TaxID=682798 RepID=UPI0011E6005E|nr:DUF1294 domain-containing protein [Chitinolyticbacter meiyuanensis]
MRRTGRITHWKDDKGYGFITPTHANGRVFAHIHDFRRGQLRPSEQMLVNYTDGLDAQNRPRAIDIDIVGSRPDHGSAWGVLPGLVSVLLQILGVLYLQLPGWLPVWILAISTLTFIGYWRDKDAAERGRRRIPESTLHTGELLGGWPGAWVAQRLFRHKNRKRSYQVVFWFIVLLHLAGWGWLLGHPAIFNAFWN